MGDQATFFFVGEGEIIREFAQFILRNRGEFPMLEEGGVFASGAGKSVGAEDLGRVVGRIEADAKEVSLTIASGIDAQLAINLGELVAHSGTEVGERAPRVNQS